MNPLFSNALISFSSAFMGASFSKAQGPGQALDDIMTLAGFDKLHEVAERKRADRELNVKQYKEAIGQGIISIDEKNIQEPPLAIVGPALEASKYYIEDKVLREMFAKLISTSMDKSVSLNAHPSFVEIIKQLAPLDAIILKSFKNLASHPVARIIQKHVNGYFDLMDYFVVNDDIVQYSIIDITKSIANLNRLGLIKISNEIISDKDYFMKYNNVQECFEMLQDHSPILVLERLDTTSYGSDFIRSCVYKPYWLFS